MQKKLLKLITSVTLAAGLIFGAAALAKPAAFNDVYSFFGGNVLANHVVSGPLKIIKLSRDQVVVSEPAGHLEGGIFTISAGKDAQHQCLLTIQDVDFNLPKLITKSCNGGYTVANFDASYTDVNVTLKH